MPLKGNKENMMKAFFSSNKLEKSYLKIVVVNQREVFVQFMLFLDQKIFNKGKIFIMVLQQKMLVDCS